MLLSPHFSLEELTFSQIATRQGLKNEPGPDQLANLGRLCLILLEPVRLLLGVPLHLDSGYRSPAVNELVGGSLDSAHMNGRAGDCIPIGMRLETAFDRIRLDKTLPFDQVIFECHAWIHLAIAPLGIAPRQRVLTATGGPGAWHYTQVNA